MILNAFVPIENMNWLTLGEEHEATQDEFEFVDDA